MNFEQLRKKLVIDASKKSLPIAGEFELTPFCNLKCKMCYVRKSKCNLLSKDEWLSIIKQAKDLGMIFCLFTGGEILTRGDFIEIYEKAYDMGIIISLFTNGTLINEEMINAFKKRPPESISISLYGASNETYEKVTGDKLGFDKVKNAIKLIKEAHIRLIIRTIPIKEILIDMPNIVKFIKENHLTITYNLYVAPRRETGKIPDRLTPTKLVEYENIYKKEFGIFNSSEFKYSENGFTCAAGKSAYFVTWNGFIQPCAMLNYPRVKITLLKNAWDELKGKIMSCIGCNDCISCNVRNTCIQCKAKLYLEGNESRCSVYLKEIVTLRSKSC